MNVIHTTQRRRAGRFAASVTGAAVALLAATPIVGITPASAVPAISSSAFDPKTVGWFSHRDQSSNDFAATFRAHADKGYVPVDLDIDTKGSDYRVGSVWQQNLDSRPWVEKRNLTDAEFHDEWVANKEAGRRLVEQETYVVDGTRLYAGIWIQNTEGYAWSSHRGQTDAEFKVTFEANRKAGLMPVDFDEYVTGDGVRYSTVWVQNGERLAWKLYRNLTSSEFSDKFAQNSSAYRMISFESVKLSSGQKYGGIWVENTNGRGWLMRRDLTATDYANYWRRYSDLGYRLVGFNRYETAGGTRYAGIWRQNSDRPDWKLKSKVDALVQSQLDSTDVPGISVAVFQNGTPTYLRGFGYADKDAGEWMDSGHVGSIASVSKAVAGVLTMRMVENGDLELDDKTRDWVPTMPAFHTHTVGELLSNRGCVRHYVSGLDDQANKPFATALDAAEEIWDDPLVCAPGTNTFSYGTHGYTVVAPALEAAGGDDIKGLVDSELTDPFALGTLGVQDFSSSVRRMAIYSGNDQHEVKTPNNDWKVLGGGLDSSVHDLAGFGAKLIAGQIIDEDSFDMMVTPPDGNSNYAYGWETGTEDGTRVVAKGGSWTGNLAYLRLYPEKGIVVAVMMNSRAGEQSARQLGRSIGTLVLDSVD